MMSSTKRLYAVYYENRYGINRWTWVKLKRLFPFRVNGFKVALRTVDSDRSSTFMLGTVAIFGSPSDAVRTMWALNDKGQRL